MMEVKSKAKWVKIAPRKLGRVVELVRGKLALSALQMLRFMPQKGARILEKAIKSAVANAKANFKMAEEGLIISEAYVNKAVTTKRFSPRARGRMFPIQTRTSHLTVTVKAAEKKSKEEA